jgi:RNA polymerase sigma-70 factor (ECF subfamily)
MAVTLTTGRSPERAPAPDQADDRRLVEAARSDPDAFGELYRRHVGAVYAHAYRLCGSKEVAEEATSATFERALRRLDAFTWQGGGVRPWLLTIAGREVAGLYRRQGRADGRRGQMALRDLAGTTAGGSDAAVADDDTGADRDEALAAVRAALPRLSARYRQAIELRYLAGLDAATAADTIGCSKAALAVTLHRALGALRREFAHPTPGGPR